jgi:hypothetical protein
MLENPIKLEEALFLINFQLGGFSASEETTRIENIRVGGGKGSEYKSPLGPPN